MKLNDTLYPKEIDTTKLPDWCNWIAQDSDGTWWAYEAEPNEYHQGWYENEVGRSNTITKTTPNKDWLATLVKIRRNDF